MCEYICTYLYIVEKRQRYRIQDLIKTTVLFDLIIILYVYEYLHVEVSKF